jgi:ABC-type phosphate transport system substrate-binding protein
MKKVLLTIATVITTTAAGTSFYLATLSNPTDTQKQLSSTTNTIVIAGATAIFGLLNDDDEDSKDA